MHPFVFQATRSWCSALHAASEWHSWCGASGKSGLAALVADTLATDRHCYAHIVWVACEGIPAEPLSQAQQKLVPLVRTLKCSKWPVDSDAASCCACLCNAEGYRSLKYAVGM